MVQLRDKLSVFSTASLAAERRDDFSGATTELRLIELFGSEETNNFPFYQTQSVSKSVRELQFKFMFVFLSKNQHSNQSIFY